MGGFRARGPGVLSWRTGTSAAVMKTNAAANSGQLNVTGSTSEASAPAWTARSASAMNTYNARAMPAAAETSLVRAGSPHGTRSGHWVTHVPQTIINTA